MRKQLLLILLLGLISFNVEAQGRGLNDRLPGPIQPIPSDGSGGSGGSSSYFEKPLETVSGTSFLTPTEQSELRVVNTLSGSGELVLTGENCFGVGPFEGGQVITFIGQSDLDYVKIGGSDTFNGCIVNGEAKIQRYRVITFVYNSILSRWVETYRNF